jgi:hypothetical protein
MCLRSSVGLAIRIASVSASRLKRRGVAIRSNKSVISTQVNTKRPVDQLLSEALSSPFAIPGVPLRVSTFALRDADSGKYRLRLAAPNRRAWRARR